MTNDVILPDMSDDKQKTKKNNKVHPEDASPSPSAETGTTPAASGADAAAPKPSESKAKEPEPPKNSQHDPVADLNAPVSDIWQEVFKIYNKNADTFSKEVDGEGYKEHHKCYTHEGYTTCCPNCADVHVRSMCLYDLTDVIIYYLSDHPKENQALVDLNKVLIDHDMGGIDFTEADLRPGMNGARTLEIKGERAIAALCRAVFHMNANQEDRKAIQGEADLKELFERARNWSVLKYFPSVHTVTTEKSTIKTKKVQMSHIESFLKTLLACREEVICRVTVSMENGKYIITNNRAERRTAEGLLLLRCPKCGMPVAESAGLYDEVVIGMLGLPSAGKTSIIMAINYLVSTQYSHYPITNEFPQNEGSVTDLSLKLEHNSFDIGSGQIRADNDSFVRRESIEKTTLEELYHTTITVSLCRKGTVLRRINVILIDIAGELTLGNRAHPLFYRADCFWFCLLPDQNGVSDGMPKTKNEEGDTFERKSIFYEGIFDALNHDRQTEKKIPVAIIYTRSDCYLGEFGDRKEEIGYICPLPEDPQRCDDLSRLLVSCGGTHALNVATMRDMSMKILRFFADIRQRNNNGYLQEFADIEKSEQSNPSGSDGRPCPDYLTFFKDICRYGVFACSPYGGPPIDSESKKMEDIRESIQAEKIQYETDRTVAEEEVNKIRTQLELSRKLRRIYEGVLSEWKTVASKAVEKQDAVRKAGRDYRRAERTGEATDELKKALDEAVEDAARASELEGKAREDLQKVCSALNKVYPDTGDGTQTGDAPEALPKTGPEAKKNAFDSITQDIKYADDYIDEAKDEEELEKKWAESSIELKKAEEAFEKADGAFQMAERMRSADQNVNQENNNGQEDPAVAEAKAKREDAHDQWNTAMEHEKEARKAMDESRAAQEEGIPPAYRNLLEKLNADVVDLLMKLSPLEEKLDTAKRNVRDADNMERQAIASERDAKKKYDKMKETNPRANPFGVMLPLIWTLALGATERRLLDPVAMRSGTPVKVDDDWLAINRQAYLPEGYEEAEETTWRKITEAVHDVYQKLLGRKSNDQ